MGADADSGGVVVSRAHVLEVMRRLGMHQHLAQAEHQLPDPVDLNRDSKLLDRFGLVSRSWVEDRLGGSP